MQDDAAHTIRLLSQNFIREHSATC